MRFSRTSAYSAAAAVAFFSSTAQAQNATNGTNGTNPMPPGMVMTHIIQVGNSNGSLEFFPSTLTGVNAGDLVQFQFWPESHSVAQGPFDDPCQPLDDGFWSGMMPVTAESTTMPVFTFVVNNTEPIWMYCATGRHCQSGMTAVINPPEGRTLEDYNAAAKDVEQTGIPESIGGGNSTTGDSNATVPSGTGAELSAEASESAAAGTGAAAGLRIPAGQAVGALVAVLVGMMVMV